MTSTATFCIFLKKTPSSDEITEILDQEKSPKLHKAIVNADVNIFEIPHSTHRKTKQELDQTRFTFVVTFVALAV
jgi:hypothetical protein